MRPAIYMDFARSARLDPRARVIRASGGTRRDAYRVWREVSPNTARFHHAQDGTALGLLMERARINSVNPRAESAVPGAPGTLPPGWGEALISAARSAVVGTSTTGDVQSVELEYAASGAGEVRINFGVPSVVGGAPYAGSVFAALVSPPPEVSVTQLRATNATPLLNTVTLPTNGVPARGQGQWVVGTTGATTYALRVAVTAACTFRVRVGWPQWEEGNYASTPSLPPVGTPGASTRATETLETLLADWGAQTLLGEGTLLVAGRAAAGLEIGGDPQRAIQVDLGSDANALRIERVAGRQMRGNLIIGSSSIATASSTGTVADSGDFVAMVGYDATSMALSLGGAAVVEAATGQGLNPTRLLLGGLGGTISRLAWWPRRLANAEIQSLARQGAIA